MDYSGINAKLKAMQGKLISPEEYDALCGMKNIEELGLSLKSHRNYANALTSVSEHDLDREPIEQKLVLSLYDDYASIYRFVGDRRIKLFLDSYFLKNEIKIIQFLLCMVYDERDITYTLPELNEMLGNKLNIDVSTLISAGTVPDFIDCLAGTEFHRVLADVYTEESTLFQLEMQLDLYYYMHLWKAKKRFLDSTNRKLIELLSGTETDLRNIVWIYRLKSRYSVPPNLIYSQLIPFNYKLKKAQINRLVETSSVEELDDEIRGTPYGKAFSAGRRPEDVVFHELARLFNLSVITWPDSLAATLRYIFFKETEISNLTSLVEGVRYGLEPADIMKHIMIRIRG